MQTATRPLQTQQSAAAPELITLDPAAAVRKLSIADSTIAEMHDKYMPLLIKGVDDAAGFQAVHEARMIVKTHRLENETPPHQPLADARQSARLLLSALKGEPDPDVPRLHATIEALETEVDRLRKRARELESANAGLSKAIDTIRDAVLHGRDQLAEMEVDGDVINAVLGIIDNQIDAAPPDARK